MKWEYGKECDRKDGQKEREQSCSLVWKERIWAGLTKAAPWREAWKHWHGAAAVCDSYWKSALSEVWLIFVAHVEIHCLGEVEEEPKGLISSFFPGLSLALQLAEGISEWAALWASWEMLLLWAGQSALQNSWALPECLYREESWKKLLLWLKCCKRPW